jgi:hypothetical protein
MSSNGAEEMLQSLRHVPPGQQRLGALDRVVSEDQDQINTGSDQALNDTVELVGQELIRAVVGVTAGETVPPLE